MFTDDRQHFVDGSIEVVVDDNMVGHRQTDGFLIEGLAQPLVDFLLRITAST